MNLLAQAAQASGPGLLQLPVMIVASIAIMYLMIWRPQQKRMSEDKAFREALKVDDKVVTAGGMYGKITRIETDRIEMEIASKTRVFVRKAQVAALDEPTPTLEADKK